MADVQELARRLPWPVPLRALPSAGGRVPGVVVRLLPAVVGVPLCVVGYSQPALLGVGLALLALMVVRQQALFLWVFVVFLAGSRLQEHHASLEWRFFVLLFGLHLVDVLKRSALVAPLRGWVQVAVLRRPLLRFLAIQLPVQAVSAVALWLLAPDANGRPLTLAFFGVLGAVALVVATLVLVTPLIGERSSRP
jgi:hypothetical protein